MTLITTPTPPPQPISYPLFEPFCVLLYLKMNLATNNSEGGACGSDNDNNDYSDESEYSSINEGELETVLRTMKKLHKVEKLGHVHLFKGKFRRGNQLFARMSNFFHQKHNQRQTIKQTQKKTTKQERTRIKEARYRTEVNGSKKYNDDKLYNDLKKIGENIEESKNCEPIIVEEQPKNPNQIRCHVCRTPYTQIHFFYGEFCPSCAELNYSKRTQKADMKGMNALVTGGRIKIGFQIAVKLLRDGATVYLTSRFAKDCLLRYQKEADYEQWKSNLHIIQCDFLSEVQVSALIEYINTHVTKLDILINNAAQTIVRPKEFYHKELEHQKLNIQFPNQIEQLQIQKTSDIDFKKIYSSVYSNQIQIKPEQIDIVNRDEFDQPLDKRKANTWVQKIEDVSLLDCYTTQVVNSIVPFHLISQLKPKMKGNTPSWIVNVSSMEGVFYRPGKQQFHPHTNMAKAALNMITRTCSIEFKTHNIYINSVDTGWITNENPYDMVQQLIEKNRFKCPLDCLDGAMRILDPVYLGLNHQEYPYGQFLKNYQCSYW